MDNFPWCLFKLTWFLYTCLIKLFMSDRSTKFIFQRKFDYLAWTLKWTLRIWALCTFSINEWHLTSLFSMSYLLYSSASAKKCQSRWGYTLSRWFDFQTRVRSSPPDTDTNLWKCAYFNIMTVKSQFLPPLAVSHCCKLNCATQIQSVERVAHKWREQGENCWNCTRQLLSVNSIGGWALVPYGTLQGLKRSSTSMQAAKKLEAYMGLHPVLLP